MSEAPQIARPIPRRAFELTPASTDSSFPPSPNPEYSNAELLEAKLQGSTPPSRTRSILNLTSSTLLGIYSPTGYEVSREEPSTPWGTGAQTPSLRQSLDSPRPSPLAVNWDRAVPRVALDRRRSGFRGLYLPILLRGIALFVIGLAYGTLMTRLHDNQDITPVNCEVFDRYSLRYMIIWGFAGLAVGTLQPWVDFAWSELTASTERPKSPVRRRGSTSSTDGDDGARPNFGAEWNPVVRIIGACIGIAFAIVSWSRMIALALLIMITQRKLPWQSTLQVSLTLALVNPVLWYLMDRSKPGFILSAVLGVMGTFMLLEINPDMVPSPAIQPLRVALGNTTAPDVGIDSLVLQESIGVWTWVASVLFCSCVCFGSIGRRLAVGQQSALN
jgi:Insulin-induced protein (INSIG)